MKTLVIFVCALAVAIASPHFRHHQRPLFGRHLGNPFSSFGNPFFESDRYEPRLEDYFVDFVNELINGNAGNDEAENVLIIPTDQLFEEGIEVSTDEPSYEETIDDETPVEEDVVIVDVVAETPEFLVVEETVETVDDETPVEEDVVVVDVVAETPEESSPEAVETVEIVEESQA